MDYPVTWPALQIHPPHIRSPLVAAAPLSRSRRSGLRIRDHSQGRLWRSQDEAAVRRL